MLPNWTSSDCIAMGSSRGLDDASTVQAVRYSNSLVLVGITFHALTGHKPKASEWPPNYSNRQSIVQCTVWPDNRQCSDSVLTTTRTLNMNSSMSTSCSSNTYTCIESIPRYPTEVSFFSILYLVRNHELRMSSQTRRPIRKYVGEILDTERRD